MSKYTTEVRFYCETLYGLSESKGGNGVNEIIDEVWDKVFNFDFPIFDENYRKVLCVKILKHYYTREIALETVGLWKLKLEVRMNEIMPYFNQLYKSELLSFNPLYDIDLTTTHKRNFNSDEQQNGTFTGSSNSNDNTTRNEINKYSDTPQGSLNNLLDDKYLTNARIVSDTSESENISKSNGENEDKRKITSSEDYITTVAGKTSGASYSKMLTEFRQTLLNIDVDVINSLEDLFFGLW